MFTTITKCNEMFQIEITHRNAQRLDKRSVKYGNEKCNQEIFEQNQKSS